MENLTYQNYLSNPAVREQLEREARRQRNEAIRACVRALVRWALRRRAEAPAVLQPSV